MWICSAASAQSRFGQTDGMTLPTRTEASGAVQDLGWRYLLGTLTTSVSVDSVEAALKVADLARAATDVDADSHLHVDLRASLVRLSLQDPDAAAVSTLDLDVATRITAALREAGHDPSPRSPEGHAVQVVEIGIDALDIPLVMPFWRAVLDYVDEPGQSGPSESLVDPLGRGPAVWFQQMDAPRPQRNRVHFDVIVPHDEAPSRLANTLAAGGTLLSDAHAPAFWVLADPEGNEACICTWQGRDERDAELQS
jgi:4a-hydroxytetrahydrobiopterin dehydratase